MSKIITEKVISASKDISIRTFQVVSQILMYPKGCNEGVNFELALLYILFCVLDSLGDKIVELVLS